MNIDFIKKCVPYADGFEIKLYHSDNQNMIKGPDGMGFYLSQLNESKTFKKVYYPRLITKAIEGINRGDEYLIYQDFSEIHIEHNTDCNVDEYYPFEDYKSIDAAKTAALEYIFKELS